MEDILVLGCWSDQDEQFEEGTFVCGKMLLKDMFHFFVMFVYTFNWIIPPKISPNW